MTGAPTAICCPSLSASIRYVAESPFRPPMAAVVSSTSSEVACGTGSALFVSASNADTSSGVTQSSGTGRFLRPLDRLMRVSMIQRRYAGTYLACVSSTAAANSSGRPSTLSTAIASPLAVPSVAVTLPSASRASSLSLVNLAMTRTAASCW